MRVDQTLYEIEMIKLSYYHRTRYLFHIHLEKSSLVVNKGYVVSCEGEGSGLENGGM